MSESEFTWPLTGKAGILRADEDAVEEDQIGTVLLDDILYNTIFDLCMEVHRSEKMARAETAAIKVEKLAADNADDNDPRPNVRIETDAATYDDGKVYLKGNPLTTTKDILCTRCHLPRLLAPTDGRGAQKPDDSVIYCKKQPYIDKAGYDIYGQTWVAPGPGRGKKKKDMEKKLDASVDGTVTPTPDGPRPSYVLSFPSATCSKCKRCILVTRLNNHMGSCIGNSGRNASRAAAQKISNGGNGNGSVHDGTPPSSQKGTPVNGSRAGSPRKRDVDEVDEDNDSDTNPKKKVKKAKATMIKIKNNNKPKKDKEKVKTNSFLSVESKMDDEEDEDDNRSTVQVLPKKPLAKQPSPFKKLKVSMHKTSRGSPKPKNGSQVDGGYESSDTLSEPPQAP